MHKYTDDQYAEILFEDLESRKQLLDLTDKELESIREVLFELLNGKLDEE